MLSPIVKDLLSLGLSPTSSPSRLGMEIEDVSTDSLNPSASMYETVARI